GGRAQSPGHRLAHLRIAGVGHVRVQVRLVALEHATRGGQHGRRRLYLRVAQREVEDLVGAALLLEARALLEHAADPRRPRQVLGHGLGDDHDRSIVDAAVRGASRRGAAVRAAGPPRGLGPPARGEQYEQTLPAEARLHRGVAMNFGVWIPHCRHLATPDIIRSTAVRAEQLGYDSLWVSDHVVVPHANVKNFGETVFDPLVTLAVAAGATRRVRLGTTVLIVPYRNAVVTAKMIASLDALSGGRVVLGIGAGWVAAESAMLGVSFAERGAMTDEYLSAMQELWTKREPSFAGKYTQFSGLTFEPKPLQKPHPPIWVGGHGRASLRRAVQFGAAWHPINRSPEELRTGLAEIARLCQARGRATAPAL